jgi:nicotinamidase-related amidase
MQGHFFKHPDRRKGLEEVIQNINRLIDFFDNNERPVVHAITSFNADGSDWDLKMTASNRRELIEGEYDTQILPNIHVSERHTIVRKTRYSAFFNTDLAELMNMDEIQEVVVVGAYTHYCVNATIFDAYAHDFVPCIITDAVISHLDSESEMMISRMRRNGYHTQKTSEFLMDPA